MCVFANETYMYMDSLTRNYFGKWFPCLTTPRREEGQGPDELLFPRFFIVSIILCNLVCFHCKSTKRDHLFVSFVQPVDIPIWHLFRVQKWNFQEFLLDYWKTNLILMLRWFRPFVQQVQNYINDGFVVNTVVMLRALLHYFKRPFSSQQIVLYNIAV